MVQGRAMSAPVKMVIHPGAEAIFAGADLYRVSVSRMVPQYRSHRPSQGQQTTAIWLDVQRPKQTEYQRFTRGLLVG